MALAALAPKLVPLDDAGTALHSVVRTALHSAVPRRIAPYRAIQREKPR